jgi:N-acetylmuramoyl-L-alanine amidase
VPTGADAKHTGVARGPGVVGRRGGPGLRSPAPAAPPREVRAIRLRPTLLIALLAGALAPAAAVGALPYTAVDPGHGGGDTGAVGELPAGTVTGLPPRIDAAGRTLLYEKDVNLDIGLRLDAWLRAQGARTLLTRTTDLAGGDRAYTTVGADLRARVEAANEAGVELFVSIHNNALGPTTSGTETFHYYYSSAASRLLAQDVQAEVVAALRLPDRGVKTAGFYVLRNTRMPAILVEGGFLTNPAEALMLADPAVRQRIAEAVGRGVARFAARSVVAPPRLPPTIGPWRTRPASVPAGYRLVRTGRTNPIGRGGWLAVIAGFRQPAGDAALPATIGPWRTRPGRVPAGYRLVKSGRGNPVGRGGWLAVLSTAAAATPASTAGRR